jgi:HMG (high mobility group) box
LGKPKKPLTAYQIFAAIVRKRLKAKKPNATESDRMKAISLEWAKLPGEQKRLYLEEARADKDKYEKAMTEWETSF